MQLNCGPLACVLLQSGALWDAANTKPNMEHDGCLLAAVTWKWCLGIWPRCRIRWPWQAVTDPWVGSDSDWHYKRSCSTRMLNIRCLNAEVPLMNGCCHILNAKTLSTVQTSLWWPGYHFMSFREDSFSRAAVSGEEIRNVCNGHVFIGY